MFIPLKGDKYEGHDFIPQAVESGVRGVFIHQWRNIWDPLKERASFIQVSNTLEALQEWAHFWRMNSKAQVIGLTGSNGKTTTKDFLRQILEQKAPTVASQGSFNNQWGVPLTLLKIKECTSYCVVEMGMNAPGELKTLSAMACPDVALVTNVGKAHLGHFPNVSGIAKAKEEIYQFAPPESKFVFNEDNPWTQKMWHKYKKQNPDVKTYSLKNPKASVYLQVKTQHSKGYGVQGHIGGVKGQARLSFWGLHNVENLAAALTLSLMSGLNPPDLWTLLESCQTQWGRSQWISTPGRGWVLFDAYNANPDSFEALLNGLKHSFGSFKKRVGVFGQMLELGKNTEKEHWVLGQKSSTLPWDEMFFIGPSGKSFQKGWESTGNKKKPRILNTYKDWVAIDPLSMLGGDCCTVIKGSRGGGLERVLESIRNPDRPPLGSLKKQVT